MYKHTGRVYPGAAIEVLHPQAEQRLTAAEAYVRFLALGSVEGSDVLLVKVRAQGVEAHGQHARPGRHRQGLDLVPALDSSQGLESHVRQAPGGRGHETEAQDEREVGRVSGWEAGAGGVAGGEGAVVYLGSLAHGRQCLSVAVFFSSSAPICSQG